jgi:hypothetical protein
MLSESNDYKVYIEVNLDHLPDGTLRPRSLVWEDGTRYEIDRVVDVQRRASLKAGGLGLRYTVEMGRHTRYLWLEESEGVLRWFVERK